MKKIILLIALTIICSILSSWFNNVIIIILFIVGAIVIGFTGNKNTTNRNQTTPTAGDIADDNIIKIGNPIRIDTKLDKFKMGFTSFFGASLIVIVMVTVLGLITIKSCEILRSELTSTVNILQQESKHTKVVNGLPIGHDSHKKN